MKTLNSALALIAIASAGVSHASSLSPLNTKFTIRGHVTIPLAGKDAKCTIMMKGETDSRGKGKIKGFALTGTSPACIATPTNLPWRVVSQGLNGVEIFGIGYQDMAADCPTRDLGVFVSSSGEWGFFGGSCFMGPLQTVPAITIVPGRPN